MISYYFQETKTDDLDMLELGGFKIEVIILTYKQELNDYISTHETDYKAVLWYGISKKWTNHEKNTLIGIVYILPKTQNIVVEIYSALLNWRSKNLSPMIHIY